MRAGEVRCPHCGAVVASALRTDGTTAERAAVAAAMGLALSVAVLDGCREVITPDGAGGASATGSGDSTASFGSKSSSHANVAVSSDHSAVATYGNGLSCDTGELGSILPGSTPAEQTTCNDCITCSKTDYCATEWASFFAAPQHDVFYTCDHACSDESCVAACNAMYPLAGAAYQTAISCSVCMECYNNCDSTDSCNPNGFTTSSATTSASSSSTGGTSVSSGTGS
jgi:hypothetical protein